MMDAFQCSFEYYTDMAEFDVLCSLGNCKTPCNKDKCPFWQLWKLLYKVAGDEVE